MISNTKKDLRQDLIVVLGMVVLSIPIILGFQVKPLTSAIFFFVIPTVYLFLRKPRAIHKTILASMLIGTIFGFIFDFLALYNQAWTVPDDQLVFTIRFFGFLPLDELIWFFLWVLSILVFYEHFLEHESTDKASKNYKYVFAPGLIVLAALMLMFVLVPDVLFFNYTYFVLGCLALVPLIYVLIKIPKLISKFVKVSLFFFFVYLVYELTALKLEQWSFPGSYIGLVNIWGFIFPFEEFFFWILMSSSAVLSCYELYVDDER